jgi:early secretory antigenic target protein ESAT-6
MSGDQLLVQFGALQNASQNISKAVNTLHSKLSDLESAAGPLVQAWEGDAKEAYAQRQAQWRNAAQDITNILAQIKSALDESAEQYAATERSNTNLFSG